MRNFLKKLHDLDPLVHLFFLVAIFVLLGLSLFLNRQVRSLYQKLEGKPPDSSIGLFFRGDNPDEGSVRKWIADAVATLSGVPKTSTVPEKAGVSTVTSTKNGKKTTYIPMTGEGGTTTSKDWVNVPDSDFYLDVENDYSPTAVLTWEASLKVKDGNGQAFVRLWDDTHKVGVAESEISTIGNGTLMKVYSRALGFWRGRNLYKVQIKSLTGYEVTFGSGKIKVVY